MVGNKWLNKKNPLNPTIQGILSLIIFCIWFGLLAEVFFSIRERVFMFWFSIEFYILRRFLCYPFKYEMFEQKRLKFQQGRRGCTHLLYFFLFHLTNNIKMLRPQQQQQHQ